MTNYHVNPKTGGVGRCKTTVGTCPFGGANHYPTLGEAQQASEDLLARRHGLLPVPTTTAPPPVLGHPQEDGGAGDESYSKIRYTQAGLQEEHASTPEREGRQDETVQVHHISTKVTERKDPPTLRVPPFNYEESLEAYLQEGEKWREMLSPEERQALWWYSNDPDYCSFNNHLWQEKPLPPSLAVIDERLSQALSKPLRLEKPRPLYRCPWIPREKEAGRRERARYQEGAVLSLRGYSSFSDTPAALGPRLIAAANTDVKVDHWEESYTKDGFCLQENVILTINTDYSAPVSAASQDFAQEHEHLLPRNSKLFIKKVRDGYFQSEQDIRGVRVKDNSLRPCLLVEAELLEEDHG